ncbi:chitosanase [uncultured Streptomyces sp.]|uniref:chitosanase n=1 Tax=uncultured Streptomyces sp. TaxID=174707 RepID=UPI0026257756|nr:chitosanase [uncultured Streptomyces sp.]
MTRLVLFGAPVAIAVSVLFGIGEESEKPALVPGSASEAGTETETAAEDDGADGADRQAEDEQIASLPAGLADPAAKERAARLVSSADSSTLDWRSRYGAIEDTGDGNGYTAGIVGFCSGTNDMLQLVEAYTADHPDNPLAPYLPALRAVDGSGSHEGLDPGFTSAWRRAAEDATFRTAQDETRDRLYFEPAVRLAKLDGLGTLGQYVYYDAMVLHGAGTGARSFYGIRDAALAEADTPAEGGDETAFLDAFLDADRAAILARKVERDTSRIDTAQRVFLEDGNLDLEPPLTWRVYGETFSIAS